MLCFIKLSPKILTGNSCGFKSNIRVGDTILAPNVDSQDTLRLKQNILDCPLVEYFHYDIDGNMVGLATQINNNRFIIHSITGNPFLAWNVHFDIDYFFNICKEDMDKVLENIIIEKVVGYSQAEELLSLSLDIPQLHQIYSQIGGNPELMVVADNISYQYNIGNSTQDDYLHYYMATALNIKHKKDIVRYKQACEEMILDILYNYLSFDKCNSSECQLASKELNNIHFLYKGE